LLGKYRAEGFATFVEDLFDNGNPESEQWDTRDNEDFNRSFALISQNENRLDIETIKYIEFLPYRLGKILIMNSLYYIDNKNRPVYDDIIDKLNSGEKTDIKMSDFRGIDILLKLLSISVEEFIFTNLQTRVKSGINLQIHSDFIYLLHQLSSNDNYYKDFHGLNLLQNVLNGQKNAEPDYKEILGYTMEEEEINESYQEFKRKENINFTLKNLVEKTYKSWVETKSENLAWKLTYVFDDEDIFYDDVPIIGYLDDMLVLDSE
jgi:hypothetical protein